MSEDLPTLRTIVLASSDSVTGIHCWWTGSLTLGYVWSVAWESKSHLNVIESSSNLTESFALFKQVEVAEINLWSLKSCDLPILTVNLSTCTFCTDNHFKLEGSVDLGYVCWDPWLSLPQVKVKQSSSSKTLSPLSKLWPTIVNSNSPVAGL